MNNILTWPNWLKLTTLVIIVVIVFALIHGCRNSNLQLSENNTLKLANDSLSKRIYKDSVYNGQSLTDYKFHIQVQDGLISIQENKLESISDTLDKANKRITQLLAKYKPVTPNPDTNLTIVDSSYIQDCAQCFTELQQQQNHVAIFRAEMDKLQNTLNSKINTQQLRIDELGREQVQSNKNLNDCRAITEAYQKKSELRRRIFLSMGVMSINSIMPNAAGLGAMYQDKRYRIIGFRYYTSQYGGVKALDIHLPLSLR